MSNRKLMLDDPAAYYMQLGREQERERIIQLLEKHKRRDFQDSMTDENYAETAIALIKGETE